MKKSMYLALYAAMACLFAAGCSTSNPSDDKNKTNSIAETDNGTGIEKQTSDAEDSAADTNDNSFETDIETDTETEPEEEAESASGLSKEEAGIKQFENCTITLLKKYTTSDELATKYISWTDYTVDEADVYSYIVEFEDSVKYNNVCYSYNDVHLISPEGVFHNRTFGYWLQDDKENEKSGVFYGIYIVPAGTNLEDCEIEYRNPYYGTELTRPFEIQWADEAYDFSKYLNVEQYGNHYYYVTYDGEDNESSPRGYYDDVFYEGESFVMTFICLDNLLYVPDTDEFVIKFDANQIENPEWGYYGNISQEFMDTEVITSIKYLDYKRYKFFENAYGFGYAFPGISKSSEEWDHIDHNEYYAQYGQKVRSLATAMVVVYNEDYEPQ